MRIASWNINSVRLRIDLVVEFIEGNDIDVLCLQEIKCEDQHFPGERFADAGWSHQAVRGEKSYNGVAIVSRLALDDIETFDMAGRQDARHLCALVDGRVRVDNYYVPAGGDVPDRDVNPKFGHKLDFIEDMRARYVRQRPSGRILVGDLNIAPLANDVWSTRQLRNVVSHTQVERDGLVELMERGGWHDAVRAHFGQDEVLYSWWSYRARDWAASDRGRRLDHIWTSTELADKVKSVEICRALRGATQPSDHVPVILDIDV